MESILAKGKQRLEISKGASLRIADGAQVTIVLRPAKDCRLRIKVGKGCRVDTYIIQQGGGMVTQVNRVGERSVVKTHCLWLSGAEGEVQNILEGTQAEAYDLQIFVERGMEKLRLNSVLRHSERDTKGNILVKGIVRDSASATLDGMIKIDKRGADAESFLSQHAMLLSPGAHATAKPELEIENNLVSSRHSASVSPIDEEKVFYLMSRGLGRNEAKKLIVEGFLQSAIEQVRDEGMRKEFLERAMAALD